MTVKTLINSGILELYVLNQLSDKEMAEISRLRTLYPLIDKELRAIEDAMASLTYSHRKMPPLHLKDKIINSVAPKPETKVIYFPIFKMVASILLLTSIGVLSYFLFNKNEELNSSLAQIKKLDAEKTTISKQYSEAERILSIIQDTGYTRINLDGLESHRSSKAIVYWNKSKKQIALNTQFLPNPPKGKQYQLWAIKDNIPVSLGVLSTHDSFHTIASNIEAQAFAVSLEVIGGAAVPSADQIHVLGKVNLIDI